MIDRIKCIKSWFILHRYFLIIFELFLCFINKIFAYLFNRYKSPPAHLHLIAIKLRFIYILSVPLQKIKPTLFLSMTWLRVVTRGIKEICYKNKKKIPLSMSLCFLFPCPYVCMTLTYMCGRYTLTRLV